MSGSKQYSLMSDKVESQELTTELNLYLVTNHKNLLYMLASGLIMPPRGFGNKYYQDTLGIFDDWVPLYHEKIPKSAIHYSASEAKHLIPCIVKINSTNLGGTVNAVTLKNKINDKKFPEEIDETDSIIFLPGPLPVSIIESIFFQTKAEKTQCEQDSRDFGNIPLKNYSLRTDKKLFSSKFKGIWPLDEITLPNHECALDVPIASGGIMGALLYIANRSDFGMNMSRLSFEPDWDTIDGQSSTYIAISHWFKNGKPLETEDLITKVFWGLLQHLAFYRLLNEHDSVANYALSYLLDLKMKLGQGASERLGQLIDDLQIHVSFSEKTLSELFEQNKKPIPRALILLLSKDSLQDLISYQHPMLNDLDLIYAAMLFSAREGWLGIPIELRGNPYTEKAITHRMAEISHTLSGTDLYFGTPPSRPKSIRELFSNSDNKWNKKQTEAAAFLSKKMNWDCIQTRITLPKGESKFVIEGGKASIVLQGEPKSISMEVDSVCFFEELSINPVIDHELQNNIYEKLED